MISTDQLAEMRDAGMTITEISGASGASYRSVRYAVTKMIDSGDIPPRAERYGSGEKLTLAEMVAARKSDEEIAAALGRTASAVIERRRRLKLRRR